MISESFSYDSPVSVASKHFEERCPERQPAGDAEAGAERDDGPRPDAVRKHAHVQPNGCADVRERSQ